MFFIQRWFMMWCPQNFFKIQVTSKCQLVCVEYWMIPHAYTSIKQMAQIFLGPQFAFWPWGYPLSRKHIQQMCHTLVMLFKYIIIQHIIVLYCQRVRYLFVFSIIHWNKTISGKHQPFSDNTETCSAEGSNSHNSRLFTRGQLQDHSQTALPVCSQGGTQQLWRFWNGKRCLSFHWYSSSPKN